MRPTIQDIEDRMQNGSGNLVQNRSKTTDADPDLVGSVRLEGRVIRLRGWLIETDRGWHVRLTAQGLP